MKKLVNSENNNNDDFVKVRQLQSFYCEYCYTFNPVKTSIIIHCFRCKKNHNK